MLNASQNILGKKDILAVSKNDIEKCNFFKKGQFELVRHLFHLLKKKILSSN